MYGIRHKNLYVDIATYPNLPASAEKCPLSNSPGMYVTVDSPVFAASVPLQIMRRSWSTLMSCDWRPPLGTDTLVSLTGTPITVLRVAMVLRNIPLWGEKEKNENNMLNTLAIKRDFFTYHICVTLGSVQRLNLACTQPNPFNYCETHKTVNTRNIYGMLLCCEK